MAEALSYAMTANIADLERRTRDAQRIVAATNTSIKAEFQKSNAAVSQGLAESAAQMSRFGQISSRQQFMIQNVSYQFADLAVQVSSGTSIFRALGQQLPQILGPLGTFGALAGVAAAVLFPLIGAMGGSEDQAKTLDSAIKGVQGALSDYKAAVDFANTSTEEMEKRFGTAAKGVSALASEIAAIRAEQAQRAIDGLASSLTDLMGTDPAGDLRAGVAAFFDQDIGLAFTDAQRSARAEARRLTAEFVNQQNAIRDANGDIDAQLAATQALLQVTVALAEAKDGISAEEDAIISKLTEALDVMLRQKETMQAAAGSAADLNRPMAQTVEGANGVLSAVNLIPPALAASTNGANGLAAAAALAAGNFAAAARNAAAVAEAQRQAGVQIGIMNSSSAYAPGRADGVGDASVVFGPRPSGTAPKTSPRPQSPGVNSYGDWLNGGKSGAGKAAKVDPDIAKAKSIYDATRTSAEAYAIALADLNRLKEKGLIDDKTYSRGLKDIEGKFTSMGALAREAGSAIKSAFVGLFDDPKQALEDLAGQLAQMALFSQLASSFPTVFGASGVIPLQANAKGGAYSSQGLSAYSGSVVSRPTMFAFANGAGLMGEAGAEAILPLARGGDGKLGVRAATSSGQLAGVQVNNYGSPDQVQVERTKGPSGEDLVQVTVKKQMARGAYSGPMKSRYGVSDQKVRR